MNIYSIVKTLTVLCISITQKRKARFNYFINIPMKGVFLFLLIIYFSFSKEFEACPIFQLLLAIEYSL